jgi:GTP-dependent phosphoenolpyruvate carboxykinase
LRWRREMCREQSQLSFGNTGYGGNQTLSEKCRYSN